MASVDFSGIGTRTATYNANGQVTHTVDENGKEHTTVYDPNTGFVMTDSSGDITFTYNYDGSLASELGKPASIAPPLGSPTVFTYNNLLQTLEVQRGALDSKSAYDELGRVIYHQQVLGDGKQLVTGYAYDDKGFITNSTMSGVEVNGTETSLTTSYTSDNRSRVKQIVYPNGAVQNYTYDNRGNVVTMTLGDYSEKYTYDLNNNVTSASQGGDVVGTTAYDGLDRATNMVSKTGGTVDYVNTKSYYPGGQLMSDVLSDSQFGVVRQTTYDQLDALSRHTVVTRHGNVISPQFQYAYGSLSSTTTGPLMSSTTTWDTSGNQIGYTDPHVTAVTKRDASGRVYEVDRQEDGAAFSTYFGYDDLDHQTSLGDLLGTKFTYVPRADGNFLQVINARKNITQLHHTSLGELLVKKRADGMEVDYRHDPERQVVYQGDPGAGFSYGFDTNLRLTNSTLRNGAAVAYSQFDPRNMPTTITMPGGSQTIQYNLQRQILQRKVIYQSASWEEDYTYDAAGQIRAETYIQNGGANNTATFDYDPAGPLVASHFHEDGLNFDVAYGYYADGSCKSVTYPSGVVVTELRDPAGTGRLVGLSDTNGNIIKAISWQGNSQPSQVQLGTSMMVANAYDVRGRLTGSRVTRISDGAVLSHMRYQYDPVNNVQIRQFLHRGGKADNFTFDNGERLSRAQVGALPLTSGGFTIPLYDQTYNYNSSGLDYLTSLTITTNLTPNIPAFATNWPSHDDFLLPLRVNNSSRSADLQGNVANAQLEVRLDGASSAQSVAATMLHDGLGRLMTVLRADGVSEYNLYQPNGLRYGRQILHNGTLYDSRHYVYDDKGRVLEEYDVSGTIGRLIGRYYYASGDAPTAADLYDSGSGQLQRYYYLKDASQSVIALADASGNVVERVWYDPFGQPAIELRDTAAPAVRRIIGGPNGSLMVAMSESVLAPATDPGSGSGIVRSNPSYTNVLSITSTNGSAGGAVDLLAAQAGYAPNSVLIYSPTQPVSGPLTITLNADTVADEWGNSNGSQTISINATGTVGTVYYQSAPDLQTGATPVARSLVGSPFLFQGQYFDYDTGLVYLRARFYDPFSGMFFEPDPLGYEDSVNHYAGFANDPVSLRDPSGLSAREPRGLSRLKKLTGTLGYEGGAMRLLAHSYESLHKLGMGDLEIAAHCRVMYQEFEKNGTVWEIGIRKFGEEGSDKLRMRLARVAQYFQGKMEEIFWKDG